MAAQNDDLDPKMQHLFWDTLVALVSYQQILTTQVVP